MFHLPALEHCHCEFVIVLHLLLARLTAVIIMAFATGTQVRWVHERRQG
jgi:hypothetical protein